MRGASKLSRIPPAAMAAITDFRYAPAMPRLASRWRNANCAKMRK
jgi:hypothetical protein